MRRKIRRTVQTCWFLIVAVLIAASSSLDAVSTSAPAQASPAEKGFQSLDDILGYISADWNNLTRSLTECTTYLDSKISSDRVLYLLANVAIPPGLKEIESKCSVRIQRLPTDLKIFIRSSGTEIHGHGLLYLENPYVVPGGQFNEMYGWDSYFIIRGLLRNGRGDLARGMVENFFYEIEHYGGVLNANRTYYLGRSQPPFLSSMILAVYRADQAAGQSNLPWLEKAYHFAVLDYNQWTQAPHLAGNTSLSRYFDEGEGPVPEIMGDPSEYYRGVVHYYLIHEGEDSSHLIHFTDSQPAIPAAGPIFQVLLCDPQSNQKQDQACAPADHLGLAPDAYKGDRSMRESGFDVSFRFGPFGVDAHHYAPVCLNSLLYKTEMDLEEMSRLLGRPEEARRWHEKALEQQARINKFLWNPERGLFFDYDFATRTQSSYEYATTFYPLWAGLASKEQAAAVARNISLFEQPGGLAMSRRDTDAQWDYPYGWAPIHLLTVEGLRRYGLDPDADRISLKFLSMVLQNFRRDHTLREKYNVVSRSAETHVTTGYAQNMMGFGWTNGVFLELLHESPPELVTQLRRD
jgi:alpha,alpha-trehalase